MNCNSRLRLNHTNPWRWLLHLMTTIFQTSKIPPSNLIFHCLQNGFTHSSKMHQGIGIASLDNFMPPSMDHKHLLKVHVMKMFLYWVVIVTLAFGLQLKLKHEWKHKSKYFPSVIAHFHKWARMQGSEF
jgi:hypothetical protein